MRIDTQRRVGISTQSGVAVMTLARPEYLNALSRTLTDELDALLLRLAADDTIRVVVLQADGKHFCAGADIAEMSTMTYEEATRTDFIGCSRELGRFPKPVVAAVHGMVLGGGCELVEMCDIVLAADDAVFAHPEVTLNAMPGAGGTQRLPRAVGRHLAMDMLLTGRRLSAEEAMQAGLVSRIVSRDQLRSQALALAQEIAKRPLALLMRMKQSVLLAHPGLADGLAFEATSFQACFQEEPFLQAMQAFVKKQEARR